MLEKLLTSGYFGVLSLATLVLGSATTAFAANDPDSIGRSVKYLDYGGPVYVAFTKSSTCPTLPPPNNYPVRCAFITGADGEIASVPDVLQIDVAAATGRSLINLWMNPTLVHTLQNTTSARKTLSDQVRVIITVDSAVLNNSALINPITNAPFDGKIEQSILLSAQISALDPNEFAYKADRLGLQPTLGLLSRKMLMDSYGLSSSVARQVMASAMKVRIGVSITSTGVSAASMTTTARMTSD